MARGSSWLVIIRVEWSGPRPKRFPPKSQSVGCGGLSFRPTDRTAVSESALSFDRPEVRSVGRTPIRWFPFWHIRMEGRRRCRAIVVRSLYADRESEAQLAAKAMHHIFSACRRLGAVTGGEGGRSGGREPRERASHLADRWNARARPCAPMPPAPDAAAAALSLLSLSIASIASSKGPRGGQAASLGTLPCVSPPPSLRFAPFPVTAAAVLADGAAGKESLLLRQLPVRRRSKNITGN